MREKENLGKVKGIYGAMGKGDFEGKIQSFREYIDPEKIMAVL